MIGEGEIDEAPMLFIGEKVGTGLGDAVDIAVDPIEGTRMTAMGGQMRWRYWPWAIKAAS